MQLSTENKAKNIDLCDEIMDQLLKVLYVLHGYDYPIMISFMMIFSKIQFS